MNVKKWGKVISGMLFLGLISTLILPVSAVSTDKSIGNGAVTFMGVTEESTIQVALYDEQNTPVNLPLLKMDKNGTVKYDRTVKPNDSCIIYSAYTLNGNLLVPASEYEATGIEHIDNNEDYMKATERTFLFTKEGYFLAEYDPAPVVLSDGFGPSQDIQYFIIQIGETAIPSAPSALSNLTATINQSKVIWDGVETPFEAYTINGNNYFKLRDIAYVLSGSVKQFDVTWDGAKNAINLLTNQPYTVVGGEMTSSSIQGTVVPVLNTAAIYLDGEPILLTAYTINGNNYFKLRDIAAQIQFGVSWDPVSNSIQVDTSTGYVAE